MDYARLFEQIRLKRSYLCVGLDTDTQKLPAHLASDPDRIFAFNKAIVDATAPYAVAYKPNVAFYEAEGLEGWQALQRTVAYIRASYPDMFIIADAKRGDIGNTSRRYAAAFFDKMDCDAVTVAPYMGEDSLKPFFDFPGHWTVILALTSNKGADDFQYSAQEHTRRPLFEEVLDRTSGWGSKENTMYVVGATRAEMLTDVRRVVPDHFLLVPGVGAQGGSLEDVARYGMNNHCGLLVNSSRGIIYADSSVNFARAAGEKAREMALAMERTLIEHGLLDAGQNGIDGGADDAVLPPDEHTVDLFTGPVWECDLLSTMLADAGIAAFRSDYSNVYGATPLFAANCRVRVMERNRGAAEAVLAQYLANQR